MSCLKTSEGKLQHVQNRIRQLQKELDIDDAMLEAVKFTDEPEEPAKPNIELDVKMDQEILDSASLFAENVRDIVQNMQYAGAPQQNNKSSHRFECEMCDNPIDYPTNSAKCSVCTYENTTFEVVW